MTNSTTNLQVAEKTTLDAQKKIEEIKKEISKDTQKLLPSQVLTAAFQSSIIELQEVLKSQVAIINDDKAHQAKIHNEVVEDLLKYFNIDREQAKDIVRLFARGSIRNLKINY